MSLNGAKVVAKVIEQMESGLAELTRLASRDPNSTAGRQDDQLRSALAIKLAEMQDAMEPAITQDFPPQAAR